MSNTYDVAERIVIVTGAGSGIGREIERGFLDNGATIALVGRRPEVLEESAAAYPDDRVLAVSIDLAETGAPQRLVDTVIERFGRIDVFESNAGVRFGGDVTELGDDDRATRPTSMRCCSPSGRLYHTSSARAATSSLSLRCLASAVTGSSPATMRRRVQ